MSSDNFQDVHQFDGKIEMPVFPNTHTVEQKLEQIKILLPKLTNTSAMLIMQLIIKALIDQTNDNYDDINNIDASDILANILDKPYDEMLDIIQEQLEDIWLLGQCPQGRTTRFMQIYNSLE